MGLVGLNDRVQPEETNTGNDLQNGDNSSCENPSDKVSSVLEFKGFGDGSLVPYLDFLKKSKNNYKALYGISCIEDYTGKNIIFEPKSEIAQIYGGTGEMKEGQGFTSYIYLNVLCENGDICKLIFEKDDLDILKKRLNIIFRLSNY